MADPPAQTLVARVPGRVIWGGDVGSMVGWSHEQSTFKLAASCLMLLVVAVGCLASPGAKPSDGVPAQSQPPTITAAEPSPLATLSQDEFWTGFFYGDPDFTEFSSVGALIGYSDAVIVASIESVSQAPSYDAGSGMTESDAYVIVHVDRVLDGSLTSATVPIIVMLYLGKDATVALTRLQLLDASMPHEQGILFVKNLAAWDEQLIGQSTSKYNTAVYQVVSAQGVIRNAHGIANPALHTPGTWPNGYKGLPFGAVVSAIASAKASR